VSVLNISADVKDVDQMLDRAGRPLDMRNAKAPLVAFYVRREEEQFARAPWRKLSKRYAARKEHDHPGQGILRSTGALYSGLTEPEVAEFSRDTGVVGIRTAVGRSPLFYAQFAQQGKGEPKRTVMPSLKHGERDEMVDIIRVSVLQQVLHARR
jgi:hypothetical protein